MNTSTKKYPILLLAFLLPAGLMTVVLALSGICPFGTRSLGVMDMSHQYISFLYSLRDILSGDASFFYLPSMCLGGNMAGVAAYYLLSPLNLLVCLFPRESMLEAMSLLYILRVGLCGLTMSVFCGHRNGYSLRCLFAAIAYAFMAYMLAYSFNYLWQDCVILLPLIALGIEKLVNGEHCGQILYTLCLGAALFMNFYIGYILCLFSVLFFLFELFSREKLSLAHTGKTILSFALMSLLAGALAAVAILPAFFSLMGGKAEFSLSVLTLTTNFDFIELFSKLLPGAFVYEEIMPTGMPHVFCGTITTALAVLYFLNGSIPRRRRILAGVMFAILAVSFWITALDLIWHCLNTPSWYNYRYSFLFSFLLAAAADQFLARKGAGFRPWHVLVPVILSAVITILVFAGRSYDYVTWPSALGAVLLTAAVCAGLWLYYRPNMSRRVGCVLAALLLVLHIADLSANAWISLDALTVPTSDPALYAEYVAEKNDAFAIVPDDGTYVRTESTVTHDMNRCEPMLFGYDGISHYGSTISQDSLDFLDRLGLDRYTDLWSLYGSGVTAGADTLLGVRYLVDPSTTKGYTALAQSGRYTVWKNNNALPIAWTADEAFAGDAPTDLVSFDYIQSLYEAAAPEVKESIYKPAKIISRELQNYTADGSRFTREGEGIASVTYTLVTQADGRLYGEFDIPDFPGVMVFVNNAFAASYASAQTNGTLCLGTFAAGETVTVKLQTAMDITVNHATFATESDGAIAAYSEAISQGGCSLEKLSASHYKGSFTTGAGDELLVLTIPYDNAWTVLLDGENSKPIMVQDCLMAIAVTEGSHTLEMRYIPTGFVPGAVITGAALLVLAGLCILLRRKSRAG